MTGYIEWGSATARGQFHLIDRTVLDLAGARVIRFSSALVILLLAAVVGCSMGSGPPPPEGITRIESLVSWYRSYRTDHAAKAPANEQEFLKYVTDKMKAAGSTYDPNELFVSPRDGQKYVVNYGIPRANTEKTVIAYEQEGYGGKKIVAFEMGQTREVDDAELKTVLSAK